MGLLKTQKEIDNMNKEELFDEILRLADLNKNVRRYGRGYLKVMELKNARQEQHCKQ